MDTLALLQLAGVALLLLAALGRVGAWRCRLRRLPHVKRPSLLTQAEIRFYRTLLPAVPPGLAVCVKVRLMDVVAVPDSAWREFGAPGSGMHLDFVLASAETLEPVLVVELDDSSHRQQAAHRRDAFKDAALAAAGVPILRVTAAARYDTTTLRNALAGIRGE
jgi:hypothetical protein